MSQNTAVETSLELGRYRRLGPFVYLSDFANVFKPFIGSNFLSIPFAIGQCGLALGAVGLVIIGLLTVHCCNLLVKTKYHAIEHIRRLQHQQQQKTNKYDVEGQDHRETKGAFRVSPSCLNLFTGHLISDSGPGPEGQGCGTKQGAHYSAEIQKRLVESMRYSDLARMCLGRWGLTVSNACILLTQMGFCINYAIFISNALYSFFPAYSCSVEVSNDTVLLSADCQYLSNSSWVNEMINKTGRGSVRTGTLRAEYTADTSSSKTAYAASPTQNFTSPTSFSAAFTSAFLNSSDHNSSAPPPSASTTPNLTAASSSAAPATPHSSESSVWLNTWTDAPDLHLMVLFPMALFVLLVLPRRVRVLGLISAVGNLSELVGVMFIFIPVIAYFQVSETWRWARIEGLPFFFGTVAGAFEGAGTMLPVESSMDGNWHNFSPYLTVAMSILMVVYTSLGVLSYLTFGSDIEQIVTMNVAAGSWESLAVNICMIVGIAFTFPLMALPVLNMAESTLLGRGGLFYKNKTICEEKSALLSHKHSIKSDGSCSHRQFQIAPWKRYVLRITYVIIVGCLAMLLRDSFAYVAAFIGALGSISIAYIFPCVFHLRLCWPNLPLSIKIKDLSITAAGVVFCITGIYTIFTDTAA